MSESVPTTHVLDNGLTVLVEPMTSVQSASFSLLVPSGSIYDPPGRSGTSAILSEQMFRGAGNRSNRELTTALDALGVNYSCQVRTTHLAFSGAMVAGNLPQALGIFADMVRRPHLSEEEFEPSLQTVLLSLRAAEDEPQQIIFRELKRRCYDDPWGRPTEGQLEDLPQIDVELLREHAARCLRPNESILAVAGNVSEAEVLETVERLFGDWEMKVAPDFEELPSGPAIDHRHHETEQTQIGIAYPSVPLRHPDYYPAWAAVSILSGGMSARLFTEVRERRGLCYSVFAMHHSLRHEARVLCYAGTTAERAQETLDITLSELERLREGISEEELRRCQVRAKSSLVMQQESTARRAGSMSSYWLHLGRVKSVREVTREIEALTVESILAHLHDHPIRNLTVMTIGPEPLDVSER